MLGIFLFQILKKTHHHRTYVTSIFFGMSMEQQLKNYYLSEVTKFVSKQDWENNCNRMEDQLK